MRTGKSIECAVHPNFGTANTVVNITPLSNWNTLPTLPLEFLSEFLQVFLVTCAPRKMFKVLKALPIAQLQEVPHELVISKAETQVVNYSILEL